MDLLAQLHYLDYPTHSGKVWWKAWSTKEGNMAVKWKELKTVKQQLSLLIFKY